MQNVEVTKCSEYATLHQHEHRACVYQVIPQVGHMVQYLPAAAGARNAASASVWLVPGTQAE
jgi:hypothetical protein